jgi:Glycine/D-amino acid oxidases (deaminating)
MLNTGTEAELWSLKTLKKKIPHLNYSEDSRFPIYGALVQKRAGTARHEAGAGGYARAANNLGVDIIQNCEVNGVITKNNNIVSLNTSKGNIQGGKVG